MFACERGEDTGKHIYEAALKQDLPMEVRTIIERQYQGVKANHDRVRDLRNAALTIRALVQLVNAEHIPRAFTFGGFGGSELGCLAWMIFSKAVNSTGILLSSACAGISGLRFFLTLCEPELA